MNRELYLNDTIFSDLEWHLTKISRWCHYLMLNVSEMLLRYRHSYNGILIGTYICCTQGCHFKWPWWVTLSHIAKYSVTQSIVWSLCDSWASCCRNSGVLVFCSFSVIFMKKHDRELMLWLCYCTVCRHISHVGWNADTGFDVSSCILVSQSYHF